MKGHLLVVIALVGLLAACSKAGDGGGAGAGGSTHPASGGSAGHADSGGAGGGDNGGTGGGDNGGTGGGDNGGTGGFAGSAGDGGVGGLAGAAGNGGLGGLGGTPVFGTGGGAPGPLSCVQKLYDDCGVFGSCQISQNDSHHYCFASGPTADVTQSEPCGAPGSPITGVKTVVTVRNASGGVCFTYESVYSCASGGEERAVTWKNANGDVVATGNESVWTSARATCAGDGGESCAAPGPPFQVNTRTDSCVPTFPPEDCVAGSCP